VTEIEQLTVENWLRRHPQLDHIRVRKRGDLLTLESGPEAQCFPHARIRRVQRDLWILEMPSRSRWDPTPYTDSSPEPLLDLLRDTFAWMLKPLP